MSTQENTSSEAKENTVSETPENNSVGQLLRQLRKEKGLSLQDIASETNISTSNIVSIEHEAYENLPADTFIRGQITIYGNFLGIDGDNAARTFLVERHRKQKNGGKQGWAGRDNSAMSAKKLSEPSYVSSATLAAALLLLIVLVLTTLSLVTGWNPFAYLMQKEQVPAVPLPASSSLSTPITVTVPAAEPEPAEEAVAPVSNPDSVSVEEETPQTESLAPQAETTSE